MVQAITVLHDPANMDDGADILVTVNDDPFTDLNVITITQVILQYTPNGGAIWLTGGVDTDPTDGWFFAGFAPADPPEDDGFDNDGDGLWDEEDENVYTYTLRAIAGDDGHNYGYSDAVGVTATVKFDNSQPSATITTPLNGTVFNYGDLIHIEATAVGDSYPKYPTDDIHHVLFQYKDGRFAYIDEAGHANSNAGRYDAGVDEVFEDLDGDGFLRRGDRHAGLCRLEQRLERSGPGDGHEVVRHGRHAAGQRRRSVGLRRRRRRDLRDRLQLRPVLGRLRHLCPLPRGRDRPRDELGRRDRRLRTSRDPRSSWTTTRRPAAYITRVMDKIVDPIEVVGIQGVVEIVGVVTPVDRAAYVSVYGESVTAQDPFLIGIDNSVGSGAFMVEWNTDHHAEGPYTLWATVTDDDGNESDAGEALVVHVAHRPDRPVGQLRCDRHGLRRLRRDGPVRERRRAGSVQRGDPA